MIADGTDRELSLITESSIAQPCFGKITSPQVFVTEVYPMTLCSPIRPPGPGTRLDYNVSSLLSRCSCFSTWAPRLLPVQNSPSPWQRMHKRSLQGSSQFKARLEFQHSNYQCMIPLLPSDIPIPYWPECPLSCLLWPWMTPSCNCLRIPPPFR